MSVFENPVFVLFAILFLGLALGNITIKGVALGSSGVLFVALLAGHFGLSVPDGVTGIGTALFVYCVGLGVGNRFFASLRSKGILISLLSVIVVGSAWLVTWGLCSLFDIQGDIATGLFSGACTSTPGFAAATEALQSAGRNTDAISVGYGVAYPFGVIGVVLFVQLLPRLLKQDLNDTASQAEAGKDPHQIIKRVIRVTHPELYGKDIEKHMEESHMACRITRQVKDDILVPLSPGDVFTEGMDVLLVGEREQVMHDAYVLGHIDKGRQHPRAFGDESAELIVLKQELCGIPLQDLDTLGRFGITISRVTRLGLTFIPNSETELVRNDVVRAIGSPKAVKEFAAACGHRCTALNATDVLSLTGGVALGIIVGNINFSFGDGGGSFSLGMAGGPLLVALILGHFGKIGPIAGYIPRPTRVLLMEFALMIFLAGSGVKGGASLVETLQTQGVTMFLIGVAITIVPLVLGYVIARRFLRMPLADSLGCICGSMTSTPALGALTAKADRQEPVIAYATAYPAALILMAVLAKVLVSIM